ncbi:hypothetical protein J2Z35_001179 [Acetoanaerobium pronyense]|uniref:37-kD nucleoid-associated bacterial protein n=1 Tax=Acetoanaerobium pronyense TaxID=1482736 RepID=A0ABS4KHW5_9FIRM|nr:nucleoid-associated protein [Acetoanaerobium pronyense]MBP2027385.1 hypothetical protein [Acetoanaerobium pronyense]
MQIISKSIHVINYNEELVSSRVIPDSFDAYVMQLIRHINSNTFVRNYKARSQATQIIINAKEIYRKVIGEDSEIEHSIIQGYFDDNADRLMRKEIEAQRKIARLNRNIQKGSLLQSLIYNSETEEYVFLLAKVEHGGFVDETDFNFKTGFSSDKKDIWKSCLLYFDDVTELNINNAKVYSNTVAKYWSNDFLELDEMITDETNTLQAFKAIDETLARNVKKVAPKDYMVIRHSVIAYFKGNEHLDYNSMVEGILGTYQPTDLSNDELLNLKDKLTALPEKRKFDSQFNSVPSVIDPKVKKIYKVNNGIEIKITDSIEDIEHAIKSVEDQDGNRYLKIKTNNDETFDFFK